MADFRVSSLAALAALTLASVPMSFNLWRAGLARRQITAVRELLQEYLPR